MSRPSGRLFLCIQGNGIFLIMGMSKLKVAEGYAPFASHFDEIVNHSGSRWDTMYDCFKFGYLQGMKAAKAERRKAV